MKRILLSIIICLNISYAQWSVQWEKSPPIPDGITMNSLQFIDSTTGWVVCSDGYIIKTANEGLDWELLNTGSNSNLNSISFIDSQNGWAAGNNNTILKTTDGGINWTTQTSGQPMNSAFGYIKFFNLNVGYIVGGYDTGTDGMIFSSSDNGKTWITNTNGDRSWFDNVYSEEKKLIAEIFDFTTNEVLKFTSIDDGNSWIIKGDGRGKWLKKIIYETKTEIKGISVNFRDVTPLCLKTTDGGNTWIQKTGISTGQASFTDESIGWIVLGGDIYKTTDSGETWNITLDSDPGLRMFFLNNTYGWARGDRFSELQRTTDGGQTWQYLSPGPDDGNTTDLFFINTDVGFFAGADPTNHLYSIYSRTTDGGNNYTDLFTPQVHAIKNFFFTGFNTGWAIAENGKLMKTDENGNFKLFSFFGNETEVRAVHFINQETGWSANLDPQNTIFAIPYMNILKTTNSGKLWYLQWESPVVSLYAQDIFFNNENFGWIKVLDENNEEVPVLFTTSNGGIDWDSKYFDINLINFFFISNNLAWANKSDSIYKTTNGGVIWTLQYNAGYNIHSIFFTDQNNGWAAGVNGLLIKTTDGGSNWNVQVSNTSNDLNSIKFLDSLGFAVGENGSVLKTTNNGNDWISLNTNVTNCLQDIEIVSSDFIWTVGCGGIIVQSSDGGNNWNVEPSGTTADLYDVGFSNIYEGWARGLSDTLLIYNSPVPVDLISFSGRMKNNIAELIWTTSTETNNQGFFIERNTENEWKAIGFVEGNGTTTEVHAYSYKDNLKDVSAKTISYRLKQIDFNGTYEYSNIVEINYDFFPNEFALYQNYPNPFNPVTKIKYIIPEISQVKITVYDVLGNEIKTLVNEFKPAGSYEVDFNSNEYSSGVYYYRIVSGTFSAVKKMVLLR